MLKEWIQSQEAESITTLQKLLQIESVKGPLHSLQRHLEMGRQLRSNICSTWHANLGFMLKTSMAMLDM